MTVKVYTRQQIGLRAPDLTRLALRTEAQRTTQHMGLTRHHTGAGGTLYRPNPFDRLKGIQAYHMDTLHYGDIAYNGGWDADGNVFVLRDSHYVGAHAGSTGNIANLLTDGIVFLEDARGITGDALEGFKWWNDLYRYVQRRAPREIAHRWWAEGHGGLPTVCPGDDVAAVVRFIGGDT